jgi:hypothetical protein
MTADAINKSFIQAGKYFGTVLLDDLSDTDIFTCKKRLFIYQVRGERFAERYKYESRSDEAFILALKRAAIPLLIKASETIEGLEIELGHPIAAKPSFEKDVDRAFHLFSNFDGMEFETRTCVGDSGGKFNLTSIAKLDGVMVRRVWAGERNLSETAKTTIIAAMIPYMMHRIVQKYEDLVKRVESPEANTARLFGDSDHIKKRKTDDE